MPLFRKKESAPEKKENGAAELVGVDESYFVNGSTKSKKQLPRWLNHFNAKDLKILFKSSMAVWIMTLFIFIDETLRVLGQAAFFGCIVLFIVPPSGVVFIHILAGLAICFGLATGWAWGVITMKAALATRPDADLNAQYRLLQQSMPQNTTNVGQASGQTSYAQIAIFEGFMLDTRVTVTYYCMIGLFVYLVARLRVKAPKLTLVGIFATVVADIYLTTAPLIPTFQGTIPKVMIIPVAVAVGVGAVCNLLIFPQSTSHIVLDGMRDVLAPMEGFVRALSWHFKNPESRFDAKRLQRLKMDIGAAYKNVDLSIKFLPMDFSYGKLSPGDIISLQEPLRQILVAFGELLQLSISREEARTKDDVLREAAEALYDEKDSNVNFPVAYHQIARAADFRARARHPDTKEMVAKTLDTLSTCATPLLQVWVRAFDAANQALAGSSKKNKETVLQSHQETLRDLGEAQAEFESSAGHVLIDPHSHLFDTEGNVIPPEKPDHPPPVHGLMVGLLFQERIVNLSKAATILLEKIIELEETRQKSRVWLPMGLQRIFSWGLSKDGPPTTIQGTLDLKQTITAASHQDKRKRRFKRKAKGQSKPNDVTTAAARLEEMRKPTGLKRFKASTILVALIHWFTNTEGLHALRTLILTIALAVPAVIPSSAGFYYREKGLWALIMAQMALVPYTSDFISGLIVRTAGTIVGGVIGLLCWYIGAGSGPGNPYGLAAIMAVVIVLMMWWRLFAGPEQIAAGIMLTSTMYMVVSYGWVDTHIPSYGNPGVGYTLFWRRILLVMIGFTAATIVTFFPRPPSGNRHYRHLLSDQLSTVKDRYALFASTWRSPPADLVEVTEKEAIASEELLNSIVQPIMLTKFEFSTSNIDTKALSQSCHLCINLNIYISQLLLYTEKLPLPLRTRFIRHTSAGDERLIADLMAVLTLVQQSLVSGTPLPAVLPTPLISRAMIYGKRGKAGGPREESEPSVREQLAEEGGRQWVSAVNAFVRLLGTVDDLVVVVKTAVGEGNHVDLVALDIERG